MHSEQRALAIVLFGKAVENSVVLNGPAARTRCQSRGRLAINDLGHVITSPCSRCSPLLFVRKAEIAQRG